MSRDTIDFFDDENEVPEGCVLCPRCTGQSVVYCHCGGDLCVCDNYGEKPCPLCGGEYGGEGYVEKEKADAYLKHKAEIHEAFRAVLTKSDGS